MLSSGWKTCLIDIDRASEFTGDDVDQYSELVDLGHNYKYLTVLIPSSMDSATVTPYLCHSGNEAAAEAEVPYPMHFWNDNDADTNIAQATVASTGGLYVTFWIGGAQYLRLKASADQDPDVTFYVLGFD